MHADEIAEHLPAETLAQLQAVPIARGRPLIAVDADEVLVIFVAHLSRFIRTLGYEMRLVRYQLEGSIFPLGSDRPIPFDDCIGLINRFFAEQTDAQEPVPGGAAALSRLSADAQVVVLTNVPRHATQARRRNLDALGIDHPLVVNSGGKGRAMAWLAAKAEAPCAFIDDSVTQIESVAKHAPGVIRLHFAWADFIARLFPDVPAATTQVQSWAEAEDALSRYLLRPAAV